MKSVKMLIENAINFSCSNYIPPYPLYECVVKISTIPLSKVRGLKWIIVDEVERLEDEIS